VPAILIQVKLIAKLVCYVNSWYSVPM